MVNNGSAHYDHDNDGTHSQLGGEHTGCEAKFRNKDYDTQILIRYVGDTLSVSSRKLSSCSTFQGFGEFGWELN
jgi:lectin, mannose-binding 2